MNNRKFMIYNTTTRYSSRNIFTRDDAEDTRIKHLFNMRRLNPRISLSISEKLTRRSLDRSPPAKHLADTNEYKDGRIQRKL